MNSYEEKGITALYEWQEECLSLDGVLSDQKNLVYTGITANPKSDVKAPTSAGKTMGKPPQKCASNSVVAELIVIRQTTINKKKCIIVLPFVSIVAEKTKHFRNILEGEKVGVGSFHGGARAVDLWDIAICTIEKVVTL